MKPAPIDDVLSGHSGPADSYLVAMLGAAGVGKCALLSQFRTSECINAYESGRGEFLLRLELQLVQQKRHRQSLSFLN